MQVHNSPGGGGARAMQSPMLLQVFNLARLLLVLVPVHAAEWLPIVYNSVAGQGFDHHDAALNAAAECSVGKGDVVSLRGVAECLTGVETCFTAAGATAGGIRWGTLPAPCRPHSTTLTTEVTSPVEMGVPTAGGSCPAVDFHVSKDGSIVLVKAIPAGCWGIKLDGMTFDGSKPDDWAWVTVALLLFCGGAWLIVGVAITVRKDGGGGVEQLELARAVSAAPAQGEAARAARPGERWHAAQPAHAVLQRYKGIPAVISL